MNYPQILSPVLNFLHCPTPQAWIVQARDPQNLPLLLTDHLICELKAAQTALLLVRKYVADKSGADARSPGCNLTRRSRFVRGRSRILLPCINRLAKAPCRKLMTPGDVSLSTVWCY